MAATTGQRLASFVTDEARRLGFDAVGITRPEGLGPAGVRLTHAIAQGHHGTMTWLADTLERRADVSALWSEARSVIMLGFNYGPTEDPLSVLADRQAGAISVYARNRDYHDVIKGKLKELAGKLVARARTLDQDGDVKVFVDTAPLMEKPLAAAAGLGWQGKHTNLVSRAHGSWLFLGAILTTLVLDVDPPETDHCGSCQACLDACPTAAFPAPYQLDARRCISYLTIEHAGPIDRALRPLMGNRIYGCDDCLAVCPWNKFAHAGREMKLAARPDLAAPRLSTLSALDDAGFRALFSGSPVKRNGRDRYVRNVLIAIGNSDDPVLLPALIPRLDDASSLVRGAAIWALSRLVPPETFSTWAAARAPQETDPQVRAEWGEPP